MLFRQTLSPFSYTPFQNHRFPRKSLIQDHGLFHHCFRRCCGGAGVLAIATWEWNDHSFGKGWGGGGKPLPTLPEYRYMHPVIAPRELVINGPLVQISFQKVQWSTQQKDKPTIVHRKYLHPDLKDDFYKMRRQDGLHAILPITSDIVALGYVYMDDSKEIVLTDETIYGVAFCNYYFGGGAEKKAG